MTSFDATFAQPSFRDALLLFPLAVVLHVLEEWPRFPAWARRFASPGYSDHAYVVTHVLAISLAVASTLLVRAFPTPLVIPFFALVFGPGVLCNALFHAGASVLSWSYCPGALTGLALYLPLSALLATLAVREGLIGVPALAGSLVVALAFHVLEVG